MRLRNLQTFVKVAHLGSFHAAALQLHATQPAISARIVALEDELGVQLFIRDKSGTRLSARGTQMLPYAEKLLAISQEMKSQLKQDTPDRGILRIGIAETLSHLWLSDLLNHWRKQHPLISFELISDITTTLIQQLEDHQLDLALMVSEHAHMPKLITEPLCSYQQCWVASPELIDSNKVQSLEALSAYPILSFPRDTRPWHYLQQLFARQQEELVIHTCSSVASLLRLAEQGVGTVLLPYPVVQKSLDAGRLTRLEVSNAPPELSFCCSWRLDDDRIVPRLLAQSGREIVTAGNAGA
ncbi:LysR family transcriptional regulator [Marinobacterium jannaschii]